MHSQESQISDQPLILFIICKVKFSPKRVLFCVYSIECASWWSGFNYKASVSEQASDLKECSYSRTPKEDRLRNTVETTQINFLQSPANHLTIITSCRLTDSYTNFIPAYTHLCKSDTATHAGNRVKQRWCFVPLSSPRSQNWHDTWTVKFHLVQVLTSVARGARHKIIRYR